VRLWDVKSGACLGLVLFGGDGWIAAHPDGALEATPGLRGLRFGYRENSGHPIYRIDVEKRERGVVKRIFSGH
jgi:hypothetical protein